MLPDISSSCFAAVDRHWSVLVYTMADSAARAQRAAALEEKRRRLEELKKRRTRRGEDTAKVKASASANLDEYIDGLLSEPKAAGAPEQAAVDNQVKPVEAATSVEKEGEGKPPESTTADNVIAEPAPAPPPQKAKEVFTVGTQTEEEDFPERTEEVQEVEEPVAENEKQSAAEAEAESDEHDKDPKVLSAEEVEKEITQKSFSSFINSSSKKVERMLGTPLLSDLLVDYVGEDEGVDSAAETKDTDASRFLTSRQVYECPKWTSGRDVTDMDWSSLHRELLLTTYHMPMSSASGASVLSKGTGAAVSAVSPNDTLSSSLTPRSGELQSDGLALVWSLTMPQRPEHIFTCGSPVTSGRFHPTESTLVIGGCESGQLVVWDVRAGRLPVQKSALTTVAGASSKGHTHPICSMEVIQGGLGLVTSSTGGRVNYWSLANLREPGESTQVGDSVSCFTVSPESESLLLGDEYGALYTVQSSLQSGGQRSSRKQVRKLETANAEGENLGHFGMVTSLSSKTLKKGSTSHVAGMSKGFLRGSGGLVLSSGVDWTVKLWSPAYSDAPLTSFVSHSYDYMSDVKWSPSHPSLFATASSNGTVGLWNLASSFEEPITGQDGIVVEPDALSGRGLSKLRWSLDGRRMAVASGDRVHVLSLSDELLRTKGDEDTKMMNQLMARGLISQQ